MISSQDGWTVWTINFQGYHLMDFESPSTPLTFLCEHCGRNLLAAEDLQYAIFLYGIFFLKGENDGFIGTTCPSCVETTCRWFEKTDFDRIVDVCCIFNFRGNTHFHPLKYFSPFTSSPENVREACCHITDILSHAHDGDMEIALNETLSREANEIPGIYQTYIEEIGSSIGPYFYNLWLTDEQLQELLDFENRSNVRILPRYVFKSDVLHQMEAFSWLYRNSDIYHKEVVELAAGDNALEISKNNVFYSVPALHDILTATPDPWIGASKKDSEIVSIWKKSAPFVGAQPTVPFYEMAVKESLLKDLDGEIYNDLDLHLKTGYSISFLLGDADSFIDEYISVISKPSLSYSALRNLTNRHTLEYHNAVRIGRRKEAKYAFFQIGNRFRIRFDNQELPESKIDGLKYIHFLVCNEGCNFSHRDLDDLKGIILVDKDDDEYTDEAHEDLNFIDGSSDLLLVDEKATINYKNELVRLKKEHIKAIANRNLKEAVTIQNEIKTLEFFIKESHENSGMAKKKRGEYRTVQKKIGKSIQYAIEWMKKQEFMDAYDHFSASIDPYASQVIYRSSDSNIKWFV